MAEVHTLRTTPPTDQEMKVGMLRETLGFAKQKLELYRAAHSGEYIGGMEFSKLMQLIDHVLTL